MTRTQANLLLLVIAAIWGLAFIFQKTAMDKVGPLMFVAIRSGIAMLALAPLAFMEGRGTRLVPSGFAPYVMMGGIMFFLGAALQQVGLVTATVTNTGFLTGLYVVITPFLVWMVFRRRPSAVVWMSALLAFVGTWFLGGGTIGGFSHGDMLVAISALFWASHMLVIEKVSRFARPVTFTALQFAVTGIIALAASLWVEKTDLSMIVAAWPELAFVGLLSSALTFTLLAVAMKHTPAPEAAILVSMETVFAALCAVLILSENLAPVGWFGAALMFAATLLVHGEPYLRRSLGSPATTAAEAASASAPPAASPPPPGDRRTE